MSCELNQLPACSPLRIQAKKIDQPNQHLSVMMQDPDRPAMFRVEGGGLMLDFSRQRVNRETLSLLVQLADEAGLLSRLSEMDAGEKLNITEQRAALHMAARRFSGQPLMMDGHDVMAELTAVRQRIGEFSRNVRSGKIVGASGKRFEHVVVVGIGGSYLGTEFVATALSALADERIRLHFLSNVDVHNFGRVVSIVDPETTLWIIISKSYTTAETLANAHLAAEWMTAHGIDPAKHTVNVTAKGSPGDDPAQPVLDTFHMFDYIGGRFSVTSAVGTLPLSLYLGYDVVEAFLKGAAQMDQHALQAPTDRNLPLLAALLAVWNTRFLGYQHQAIIPYAAPLAKLCPHIQQLNMESNGKAATLDGKKLDPPAGMVIFGEPGTNAQHSFFQLAHQGRGFPIDFIGVIRPQYEQYRSQNRGVTNHQELWANMLAQAEALAAGRSSEDPTRHFAGNRPSSIIVLPDLTPASIGRLLSFYEARTVFEAFLLNINPFDQFGVELGKTVANRIREQLAARNQDPGHRFAGLDPVSSRLLEILSSADHTG